MQAPPTYDDVNLLLRLYELRREERLRTARRWFETSFKAGSPEEFHVLCPPGSEEDAYFRMVVGYWEMVSSFITSNVLNRELFFQTGEELLAVWERIRDLVPPARAAYKNPNLVRNLEEVAKAYIQWMDRRAPEAYAAFAARIRGNLGAAG